MKIKFILISLPLIAFALGAVSVAAETKAKSSTSHKARPSAEKKLDGILRSADKDHNPTEPFHVARTPAEKALDDILRRVEKDKNMLNYVLGIPEYNAKKDSGYSHLFTKKFLRAVAKSKYDLNPITCAQDHSDSGYIYRTVEDDGHKAMILSLGVDTAPEEIKTFHRLINVGDDWKLDGVICGGGGEFNMDCSNSLCAEDVRYIRQKAEASSADAQFSLGVMYSLSRGVKRDYAEAAKWFHKAGEQGHADAQNYLGYLYMRGQGVKQDNVEAAKWYRKAAELGHADAQFHLGELYQYGRGVKKDNIEAAKWFRKAGEQGQVLAQNELGEIYAMGVGVTLDFAESARWYRKAGNLGHRQAQYQLGLMHEEGMGVPQDSAEAEKWFRSAADRGHQEAKQKVENLGRR